MNWYKIAQNQQYLWSDDPKLEQQPEPYYNQPQKGDPSLPDISGDIKDDIENAMNIKEVEYILEQNGFEYDYIQFPKGQEAIKVYNYEGDSTGLIFAEYPFSVENSKEWIYGLGDATWYYVNEKDMNKEFWDGVSLGYKLYHGTSEENIENIMKEGLVPASETRALSNRYDSDGVYTSSDPSIAANYYDVVIEIDVGKMKQANYMPTVQQEGPVDEAEALGTLAWILDVDNIDLSESYSSEGISEDTVVFLGKIPPQFLRLLKE